jgi:hypothetical protein
MGASALSRIVFFCTSSLVLASDRNGLSFYSYGNICIWLQFNFDEYVASRDGLIEKDLIAFDGSLFQVLSLPQQQPER